MNSNTMFILSLIIVAVGAIPLLVVLRLPAGSTNQKTIHITILIFIVAVILSLSLQLVSLVTNNKERIAGLSGETRCQTINPAKVVTFDGKKVLFSKEWLVLLGSETEKNTSFGKSGRYVFEKTKRNLFVPPQGFTYQVQKAVGPFAFCPR